MDFIITVLVIFIVVVIGFFIFNGAKSSGTRQKQERHSSFNFDRFQYRNIKHLVQDVDKTKLKEINKNTKTIWFLLNKMIEHQNKMGADIPVLCTDTRMYLIKRTANSLPIEKINRDGTRIPISPLKKININTIGQLMDSNVNFRYVYGIGETSAFNIKNNLEKIRREITNNTKLVISLDDKNKYVSELVKTTDIYISLDPIVNKAKRILETKKEIEGLLIDLKNDFKHKNNAEVDLKFKNELTKLNSYFNNFEDEVYFPFLKVIKTTTNEAWDDFAAGPIKFITLIEKYNSDVSTGGKDQYGLTSDIAKELKKMILLLEGLKCSLRPYQEWGTKYLIKQERSILGDEMGLGKTVQAIAAMVHLHNLGKQRFMVVCPLSVLTNWCREIQKFSSLKIYRIYGNFRENYLKMWLENGGVAVTTYETLGSLDLTKIYGIDYLVIDEAHLIKNPSTNRSYYCQKVISKTDRISLLTGTVLENKVDEMIQLIDYLQPSVAKNLKEMTTLRELDAFKNKVAQVYFRRKRSDVLSELPEKTEIEDWCDLNEVETSEYEKLVLSHNYISARRVSWNVPSRFSTKLEKLKNIVEEANNDGRKILVFSYFLDTINLIVDEFKGQAFGPITGKVSSEKRQEIIDKFNNSSSGSILAAQIVAGGVGLNIQSASVVVICEPQFKPSIESQAISRSYRMGQPRNVLVYHLLATDTLEERVIEILNLKQKEFNDFADGSQIAEDSFLIDSSMFTGIMKKEVERIKQKSGAKQVEIKEITKPVNLPTSKSSRGVSVTKRIEQVSQPRGGYINIKDFKFIQLDDGKTLGEENVNAGLIGSAVDYLTRYMAGAEKEDAFSIPLKGATNVNQTSKANDLLSEISGLDEISIKNAIKLAGYDSAYRAGLLAFKPIEELTEPSDQTVRNVHIMVKRSLEFFKQYGPITKNDFTFEGGYTNTIASGDGDFLTKDTLWDFKVIKNSPSSKHTLQILIYYIMGKHSGKPEFKTILNIGIFNPRLNYIYILPISKIPYQLITEVENVVIGY